MSSLHHSKSTKRRRFLEEIEINDLYIENEETTRSKVQNSINNANNLEVSYGSTVSFINNDNTEYSNINTDY